MFRFAAIFLVALVPAIVLSTPFESCGPGIPPPLNLEVSDCDVPPCRLVRGSAVNVYTTFSFPEAISDLQGLVVATAFGVVTPYPLPAEQADVCNRLTIGECPLDAGEVALYHMVMPILEEYPITPLQIKIFVQAIYIDRNVTVSCFEVAAETVLA